MRFGSLVVRYHHGKNKQGNYTWYCDCDCGNSKVIAGGDIQKWKPGHDMSCGCKRRITSSKRMTTHGMSQTPEYMAWSTMIERCYRKNKDAYVNYGGRGITVSKRWLESFDNFYADMGVRPSDDHSLDRIDNNKSYRKANCRWATTKEQAQNRRSTVNATYNDVTKCISEWAKEIGVATSTMSGLYKRFSIKEIMEMKVMNRVA